MSDFIIEILKNKLSTNKYFIRALAQLQDYRLIGVKKEKGFCKADQKFLMKKCILQHFDLNYGKKYTRL